MSSDGACPADRRVGGIYVLPTSVTRMYRKRQCYLIREETFANYQSEGPNNSQRLSARLNQQCNQKNLSKQSPSPTHFFEKPPKNNSPYLLEVLKNVARSEDNILTCELSTGGELSAHADRLLSDLHDVPPLPSGCSQWECQSDDDRVNADLAKQRKEGGHLPANEGRAAAAAGSDGPQPLDHSSLTDRSDVTDDAGHVVDPETGEVFMSRGRSGTRTPWTNRSATLGSGAVPRGAVDAVGGGQGAAEVGPRTDHGRHEGGKGLTLNQLVHGKRHESQISRTGANGFQAEVQYIPRGGTNRLREKSIYLEGGPIN
eukprot:3533918-Pyramimonas_sp.AAC.1